MAIRIRIEPGAVRVFTDDPGARPETTIPHRHTDDDRFLVVGYLRDCLADGGRAAEREHPRHGDPGQPWFELLGRQLWQQLPLGVIPFLVPPPKGRKRVFLELALDPLDRIGAILHRAAWELAHYPSVPPEPLGTSSHYTLSRYIDVTAPAIEFQPIGSRIRVLLVCATDSPLEQQRAIRTSLKNLADVELVEWSPTDVGNCLAALEERASFPHLTDERFDIIQFVAHGREESGTSFIALSDSLRLGPEHLRRFTSGGRCRVVFLASCSSAGAARAILAGGVLGVIAMHYDINVASLQRFNGALYRNIVEGKELDEAVQNARQAIESAALNPCCGAPMLFVRSTLPIQLLLDFARPRPSSIRPVAAEPQHLSREEPDRVTTSATSIPSAPRDDSSASITTILGLRVRSYDG